MHIVGVLKTNCSGCVEKRVHGPPDGGDTRNGALTTTGVCTTPARSVILKVAEMVKYALVFCSDSVGYLTGAFHGNLVVCHSLPIAPISTLLTGAPNVDGAANADALLAGASQNCTVEVPLASSG